MMANDAARVPVKARFVDDSSESEIVSEVTARNECALMTFGTSVTSGFAW